MKYSPIFFQIKSFSISSPLFARLFHSYIQWTLYGPKMTMAYSDSERPIVFTWLIPDEHLCKLRAYGLSIYVFT